MYTLQISTNTVWAAVQSLVRELRSHMLRGAVKKLKRKEKKRDFPGSPAVKTLLCHCRGLQVQCLVKELRSHMLHGAVKKLKGKEKKKSDNTKC